MKIKTLLFVILFFYFCGYAAGELTGKKCAIIVSNRYKPYMDVVQGLSKDKNIKYEILYLPDNPKKIELKLKKNDYDFVVAVGVQSLDFVKKQQLEIPVFYSLLVYPPDNSTDVCGVYLQPSPDKLADILHNEYPDVNNLIIPATSEDSMKYIKKLEQVWHWNKLNLMIIDLKGIKQLITKKYDKDWIFVFIPDELFSSDILIKEIIDLVGGRFKVVGYNPFFCAIGADICFENNYVKIGEQTYNLIDRYYKTGACVSESAVLQIKYGGKYEK